MHLLTTNGRKALLEFLRNLTPQVLLLSCALYFYVQWSAKQGYWSFALFLGLTGLAIMAAFANMDSFLSSAFSQSDWVAQQRDEIVEKGLLRRIWRLMRLVAKHKPVIFIELLVALIVIYGASATLLVTALATVKRMYS